MSEVSSAVEAEFRGGPRAGAPLPPGPLLGFVVAVAAVAFIALLTYRSLQTRSLAARRVTHTLQVMDQLETILSLAKDAETGQRGYLLTGEEPYLRAVFGAPRFSFRMSFTRPTTWSKATRCNCSGSRTSNRRSRTSSSSWIRPSRCARREKPPRALAAGAQQTGQDAHGPDPPVGNHHGREPSAAR